MAGLLSSSDESHGSSAGGVIVPGAPGSADSPLASAKNSSPWADVPWRAIVATIGLVIAASLGLLVIYIASRVVILVLVAGFFAVVLARPAGWVQTRFGLRRSVAVGIVVVTSLAVLTGLIALFVFPVRGQLISVLTDLPGTVRKASVGRGPLGQLVTRLHLEQLVRRNQETLTDAANSIQASYPSLVGSAIQTAVSIVTVAVMTIVMLTQSASLARGAVRLIPVRHRGWITIVARDAASAVSGYMIGNLLISLCAGVAALAVLLILGVPQPVVLALFVAFADLIPLVGAALGAVIAVFAAFSISTTAGIVAVVFFVVYQQFENTVLQIVIMSRAVRVNPLVVLLSVLIGVELLGLVGALLALPIAGVLGVVAKESWRHRPRDGSELVVVTTHDHDVTSETANPSGRRHRLRRSRRDQD